MAPATRVTVHFPVRAASALQAMNRAEPIERISPMVAVERPASLSWAGATRNTTPSEKPPSSIRVTAPAISGLRRARPSAAVSRSCCSWRPSLPWSAKASATTSPSATAARIRKGAPRPTRSARTPANTGPTIPPRPATAITAPTAPGRSSPAESDSHDRPADQITAEETPKASRAATSVQRPTASPWPRQEAASSRPAASVTRRWPSRSPATPPGMAPATIARLAAERATPDSNPDRSKASR